MRTRAADYGLGTFDFPRGWFAMATSAEATRIPSAVRAMGKDMVLYRTEDGRPVLLDAYCPHMGTHLASGGMSVAFSRAPQVQGDTIACPLHGWRFGSDGRTCSIPYSTASGDRLSIRSYVARDYGGFVIAWHDPEGGDPEFEPALLPEYDDPQWLRCEIHHHGDADLHQAELIDHHVDKIHIVTVHGQDNVSDWVTHIDGVHVSQRSTQVILAGDPPVEMRSVYASDYRGPGIMVMRVEGPQPMVIYSASTPVEDGTTRFWNSLLLKASGSVPDKDTEALAQDIGKAMYHAFHEDHDILCKKRPSINPKLVPGDGAFRQIRTWYRQFFNPRADAAAWQARANGDHATPGEVPVPWAQSA